MKSKSELSFVVFFIFMFLFVAACDNNNPPKNQSQKLTANSSKSQSGMKNNQRQSVGSQRGISDKIPGAISRGFFHIDPKKLES